MGNGLGVSADKRKLFGRQKIPPKRNGQHQLQVVLAFKYPSLNPVSLLLLHKFKFPEEGKMVKEAEGWFNVEGRAARDESGILSPFNFTRGRSVGRSLIGGVKKTQEMLDFCGEHNISCTIEKISMDYVNTAMERLVNGDVKYRFVIDSAQSFKPDGRSDE